MMTRHSWPLLGLFVLLAAAPASGQGAWKTFEHKETGIRLRRPSAFDATPLQPTEKVIIAKMAREKPLRANRRDRRTPEAFQIFVMPDPTTGQDEKAPITSYDDIVERQNRIHTIKDLLASRFRGWSAVKAEGKGLGEDEEEYDLLVNGKRGARIGYLYKRKVPGYTWGVVGFSDEQVSDVFARHFRKIGQSIERPEGYDRVKDDSDDFYANKDFRDVPFRVAARQRMVKGWKAHDTENFFVLYDTDNFRLVNKIATDLEVIRAHYEEMFPPVGEIEAVSVVRICENAQEYARYGGPAGSAGYWNFVAKELVLFDMSKMVRQGKDGREIRGKRSDSYITLYHEAFHQYIFYALGELSPDYWFNEGNADYFSGTTVYSESKRVKGIEENPWRIPVIARTLGGKGQISLNDLVTAKRQQYYDPRRVGLMYAYGWSLCFFLHQVAPEIEEKEGVVEQKWPEIVSRYYDTLKAAREKHVVPLGPNTPMQDRQVAEELARSEANRAAFEGVDQKKLEAVWVAWLEELTKDERRKIEREKKD
ncbi:MAG: hypothetical protein R3F20_12005 [Planctomycetota bacterium]